MLNPEQLELYKKIRQILEDDIRFVEQKIKDLESSNNKDNIKKSYPFMTYDDGAKAIGLYIRQGKYFVSETLGYGVHADLDENNNLLGLEILLPESYNQTSEQKIKMLEDLNAQMESDAQAMEDMIIEGRKLGIYK